MAECTGKVQVTTVDEVAMFAERRVNAIRELSEMIAMGGDPVALAVQCVEALEDMGWSDD